MGNDENGETGDADTVQDEVLICLDQFLKATALVETGGLAKLLIQSGQVQVNGQVETRRRKKLVASDEVTIEGRTFRVGDAFVDDDADDGVVSPDPEPDDVRNDE